MIILNVNGPINSGKTTVSRLLVRMLHNAKFIEVDDLLSDDEETKLGLAREQGWAERLNRLDKIVATQKKTKQYETIIFAYPMTDNLYRRWSKYNDATTRLICVTLSPSLERCLTNRGTRELTAWETGRIREMYATGYTNPTGADLVICNDNQTPQQTAQQIAAFVQSRLAHQK